MKIFLTTVILICYAICVNGNRLKRGLSVEKQKKLVDELNKDREMYGRKTNIKFEKISYDLETEKWLESLKDCSDMFEPPKKEYSVTPLKYNDVMKEIEDDLKKKGGEDHAEWIENRGFFGPKADRIGCSATLKCSTIFEKKHKVPENIIGRKLEVYGACGFHFDSSFSMGDSIDLKISLSKGIKPPKLDKYADIIGMNSAYGTVFSLILSLLFILYF